LFEFELLEFELEFEERASILAAIIDEEATGAGGDGAGMIGIGIAKSLASCVRLLVVFFAVVIVDDDDDFLVRTFSRHLSSTRIQAIAQRPLLPGA